MDAGAVRRIAVIGAGQMGAGIAEVAARAGIAVALCDSSVERAELGRSNLLARLERLVEKGKLTTGEMTAVDAGIRALDFAEALAEAEFVVEAASENMELKLALFARADAAAPQAAGLASNTSSISITRLAAATRRPERVLGLHFMNPVPRMTLVELVRGVRTSAATLELGRTLALRLGKTVIVSEDSPGFLVNRMLLPFLNEACFALQEGVGSAEDIDQGARLGLNHPLGPLELADLIGLDTVLAIAEVLQRELGDDKYRPSTLLRNLVAAGCFGKKSGRGFYVYDARGQKVGAAPSGGSA
jgi:3-hydroxybutyryl-CoA dehydrogenase